MRLAYFGTEDLVTLYKSARSICKCHYDDVYPKVVIMKQLLV